MHGAVAFAGADIDVDLIGGKGQAVDDDRSQDGAINPGQKGGRALNTLLDNGLIQIEDRITVAFNAADDRERWNADDADFFFRADGHWG